MIELLGRHNSECKVNLPLPPALVCYREGVPRPKIGEKSMVMTNDGTGLEMMIAAHGPLVNATRYEDYDIAHLTHPLPVLSRSRFATTRSVIDSLDSYCYFVRVGTQLPDLAIHAVHNGDNYSPGTVTEDGLKMPCIWVQ